MISERLWVILVGLMSSTTDVRARPENPTIRTHGPPAIEGVASWYGWEFNGRPMANGQRFRALGISAASPWLPLGTRVRVTNLDNGRGIVLTITDRGPFVAGRILDLSLGAAKQLRMEEAGLARVRVELV